jgi:hypothetical protein
MSQRLESYYSKVDVWNPIIAKRDVWSPIIANFSMGTCARNGVRPVTLCGNANAISPRAGRRSPGSIGFIVVGLVSAFEYVPDFGLLRARDERCRYTRIISKYTTVHKH